MVLPLPDDFNEETRIISHRGRDGAELEVACSGNTNEEIEKIVTLRELRSGETLDGKVALKTPSGNLSTAEAIAVMMGGLSQANWFGNGKFCAEDISSNLVGAIVKDPVQDKAVLEETETVLKKRKGYSAYYKTMNDVM